MILLYLNYIGITNAILGNRNLRCTTLVWYCDCRMSITGYWLLQDRWVEKIFKFSKLSILIAKFLSTFVSPKNFQFVTLLWIIICKIFYWKEKIFKLMLNLHCICPYTQILNTLYNIIIQITHIQWITQ